MNLKKIGKLFTNKFVETGPSSYKKKKKRNYRAAVSQRLINTGLIHVIVYAGRPVCPGTVSQFQYSLHKCATQIT